MTPLDLFWNLDSKNRQIAQNAIRLRFNLQSKSPASKRSESGGWDLLVSAGAQAPAEMAAKTTHK